MSLEDFVYPSSKNITIWSGVLFFALLFLLPPEDVEGQPAGQDIEAPVPLTGLATLPRAECGDLACSYPETQLTCASDCRTTAGISSFAASGGEVDVDVEFMDWRYKAGQKVAVGLTIEPEGIEWNADNGCIYGSFDMGPRAEQGVIAWSGGTVSEDGHFKSTVRCRLPAEIDEGFHTLSAKATMVF